MKVKLRFLTHILVDKAVITTVHTIRFFFKFAFAIEIKFRVSTLPCHFTVRGFDKLFLAPVGTEEGGRRTEGIHSSPHMSACPAPYFWARTICVVMGSGAGYIGFQRGGWICAFSTKGAKVWSRIEHTNGNENKHFEIDVCRSTV